jgi:radical SAM superfamily enzyme YgiQ (UPF0313 family)
MKILLVMPDGKINKLKLGPIEVSFREAPLTLTFLAALVPEEIHAQITLVDESVGTQVPFDESFDLVGISVMTGTSTRGYLISDSFRRKGIPVVLGGVHVRLRPEEARGHADTIVVGFAEETWPQLLRDHAAGRRKEEYSDTVGSLRQMPAPRRDLQKRCGYLIPNTVLVTRGCRGHCDFCSVPAAEYPWDKRPISEVIDEIRGLKGRRFAISDVHLTQDTDYAKEFLTALVPLKKKWGALASTQVVKDDELLDLLRKSGCSYLLLGFESMNNRALSGIHKGFNRMENYPEVIEKLHSRNITVQGCFIFGFDEDDRHVFSSCLDTINDLKIDIPRYALFTPYPGTPAYRRLKQDGRLLHEQWEYYDTQHVVLDPLLMSPQELESGFKWVWKNTFRVLPSLRRSAAGGVRAPVTFVGNLAYKLYIHRLFTDTDRFPQGCAREGYVHTAGNR